MSRKFEWAVTIVTLASVILAIILYIPEIELSENQNRAIYIFDVGVVGLLAYDFYSRMKSSNQPTSRFLARHWYEILAMLPLVLFAAIEQEAFVGVVLRSLRLIRLFRLVRLVRLANLFRTLRYLKSKGSIYLILIFTITIISGSIAIYTTESGDPNTTIKTFDDALWFAITTMTISGFGDVYPVTMPGKIISVILIFMGLAVILGFISSLGASLVESRLRPGLKLGEETRTTIKEKIDKIERLERKDIHALNEMIRSLHETLRSQQQEQKKPE